MPCIMATANMAASAAAVMRRQHRDEPARRIPFDAPLPVGAAQQGLPAEHRDRKPDYEREIACGEKPDDSGDRRRADERRRSRRQPAE